MKSNLAIFLLKRADPYKFEYEKILHREANKMGYGFTDAGPNELVSNLFIWIHPELDFKIWSGPLSTHIIDANNQTLELNWFQRKRLDRIWKCIEDKAFDEK